MVVCFAYSVWLLGSLLLNGFAGVLKLWFGFTGVYCCTFWVCWFLIVCFACCYYFGFIVFVWQCCVWFCDSLFSCFYVLCCFSAWCFICCDELLFDLDVWFDAVCFKFNSVAYCCIIRRVYNIYLIFIGFVACFVYLL